MKAGSESRELKHFIKPKWLTADYSAKSFHTIRVLRESFRVTSHLKPQIFLSRRSRRLGPLALVPRVSAGSVIMELTDLKSANMVSLVELSLRVWEGYDSYIYRLQLRDASNFSILAIDLVLIVLSCSFLATIATFCPQPDVHILY
jgi:hypothetical protein